MSRELSTYLAMWHWGIPPLEKEDTKVNTAITLPYLGTVYGLVTYNYSRGAYELSLGKFTGIENDKVSFVMAHIYTDKDTARLLRKVIRRYLCIRYVPGLKILNKKETWIDMPGVQYVSPPKNIWQI